jgi:hypothetical protein
MHGQARRCSHFALLLVMLVLSGIPTPAGALSSSASLAAGAPRLPQERYAFAFPEEFACEGLSLGDPRRFRMKCVRSPPRQVGCICHATGRVAYRLACTCAGATNASGAPVALNPPLGPVEAIGLRDPDDEAGGIPGKDEIEGGAGELPGDDAP